MSEIMRHIMTNDEDPKGHMLALDEWSEDIARTLAKNKGIEAADIHLELAGVLRKLFKEHGPWKTAREVLKILEANIDSPSPRKSLYELFPGGPVNQACYIAGLPQPADCIDPSFGISQ